MMPSMLRAGVYGAVLHYLKAVQQAGTDDSDKVAAAMKAMPINDAFTKDAKIRADGRIVREMYLARVKKPADSKGPWDYFEIVRKIAPEETVWPLSETIQPNLVLVASDIHRVVRPRARQAPFAGLAAWKLSGGLIDLLGS
jgi:branched-chain amino acid transport system substrate-binding protein